MYTVLLLSHSIVRYFVVLSIAYAAFRAIRGWRSKLPFTKSDDTARHLSATFAHIQLMIGYVLYFNSPFIAYFRSHFKEAIQQFDFVFFGTIHITLMTIAIVLITLGSSVAKRHTAPEEKFRTMAVYYLVALVIILCAIPWPFSPLAARPYFRLF